MITTFSIELLHLSDYTVEDDKKTNCIYLTGVVDVLDGVEVEHVGTR